MRSRRWGGRTFLGIATRTTNAEDFARELRTPAGTIGVGASPFAGSIDPTYLEVTFQAIQEG
jgi:hypothetical protein